MSNPTTDTDGDEDEGDDDAAETFPRSYVEKLRSQNARYRERAKTPTPTASGCTPSWSAPPAGWPTRPTSIPHLDDPDALAAALDDLMARKPHLASRRPTGDIGQGASRPATGVSIWRRS